MFIEANDQKFWDYWSLMYQNCSFISPLYSMKALDYYKQRPIDEGSEISDCSFVYVKNDTPCASLIISQVHKGDRTDLLANEIPGTSVVNSELLSRKDMIAINKKIESIVNNLNGELKYRDFLNNGNINFVTRKLLSLGCVSYPFFSVVIDLRNTHELLHQRIRKSYKSLINSGEKNLKINTFDYKNISDDIFSEFKELHIFVSGRRTRSDDSWKKQLEMIKNKEAFLITGSVDDKMITGSYYMYSDNVCYYGVSASIRELFDKPLSHALVWKAVMYAKETGCSFFEMGEQKYIGNSNDIDEKQIAISDFKAGFGGDIRVFIDIVLDNYRLQDDSGRIL